MPTPVSDGEKVYVWIGTGIAACFDLDGKKEWMTRIYPGDLTYGSSPALADGVLVTFLNRLYGFDAQTGQQLWEQPKVRQNVAALMAAKLSGEQVVVTQRGDVIRPKDGELLFRPRGQGTGDEGWSPPVIFGETVYLPRFGVNHVSLLDFTAAAANKWQPKQAGTIQMDDSISRGEGGKWIDRWTAGSPLIWQGLSYQVDIYHNLFVGDVKTGKMLYRQLLPLEGLMHYNSVPVAASPTLVGDSIVILDNQGTSAVIQPGTEYKLLAVNKIGTVLDRNLPLPAQETLSYSPPIVDGNRMYIRGEAFLYCVGER
ncbi:MAG: PQQ-binding-like beta-propeller repeat protein [Pirellulaceae bacterium]